MHATHSKPNTTQMRDTQKGTNIALIYRTQPSEVQTTSLAIRADGKIQLRIRPLP